jgi:hypothetical protein
MSREKYPHYYKHCPYEYIDVYRVLDLFGVSDQAIGHAIKKLLVAGGRGHKDIEKDIKEAIVTLERRVEMWEENKPTETLWSKCTVDDIYAKADWGEGVDFTEDKQGYFNFNFNKPTDSLGPLPKVVEKVPELTKEEKRVIMERYKYLGDLYEIK